MNLCLHTTNRHATNWLHTVYADLCSTKVNQLEVSTRQAILNFTQVRTGELPTLIPDILALFLSDVYVGVCL